MHTDAHFGNVLKDGDALTLIDFDGCADEWFASDLGIVLFYAAIDPLGPGRPIELLRRFRDRFLDGYARENALPAATNTERQESRQGSASRAESTQRRQERKDA
ncbi:hypothetical protein BE20_33720 [Sorangium cellulosum]|nr:hypothetical protein BE20_33720 [Sorangium cellulosum]